MKFLKITVVCPAAPHSKYKLTVRYQKDADGVFVHQPIEGCDFFNGSATCTKCAASLNTILYKNQELYVAGANTEINPSLQ